MGNAARAAPKLRWAVVCWWRRWGQLRVCWALMMEVAVGATSGDWRGVGLCWPYLLVLTASACDRHWCRIGAFRCASLWCMLVLVLDKPVFLRQHGVRMLYMMALR